MIFVTRHEKSGGGTVAKQDGDTFTRELILDAPKRGRGRPRLDNPLTPAERAKAYRDRKRKAKAKAAQVARYGVPILYRGPNGETWSGRGLMPRWISTLCRDLECDKSAFLVQA